MSRRRPPPAGPVTVNWGWMRLRFEHARRCQGAWTDGDRRGRKACEVCGVWRWHPVHLRRRKWRA